MKPTRYIVVFRTGIEETVHAFSEEEAKILAQARQIQAGNNYDVSKIIEKKDLFD